MGKWELRAEFSVESLKGWDYSEGLGIDSRIILKRIWLDRVLGYGLDLCALEWLIIEEAAGRLALTSLDTASFSRKTSLYVLSVLKGSYAWETPKIMNNPFVFIVKMRRDFCWK
jgi:hypothetical protein